ncbi:nitroreductase family protein [Desulfosporosinus sp.]|uniref:nitroreductase family protein n=1 Tax=Desulfosporosinus sp. TaxID=157907 RepID=UPI0025BEF5BF|nr:nitroreductase family protein [Desulfosporosinus sp.]MBC2721326.1 nitroreductase family protein [Desulfosporosinus sp.]MBC2728820.1 nitroreductase family protein [Desulfosporosinus sp.]
MNFLELVQTRRSLRTYLDKPVEPEKLEYVLECARLAPSWKNMQCWRFIVIEDAAGRAAMAESMGESNPGRKALTSAPIVIVLCAVPKESEVWEGKDNMMLDAGLAMEHLILAATEQGLGTCWQGLFTEEKVRAALNVPEDVRVVAMTPLGYAAEERRPRPRKAMPEIAFKGKWGQA